jgi:hypothetical protein
MTPTQFYDWQTNGGTDEIKELPFQLKEIIENPDNS